MQQRPSLIPALLARLLTHPQPLDTVSYGESTLVQRHVNATPEDLATLAGLDAVALSYYRRGLQRKRLTNIETIFPGSLTAARTQYGGGTLAAEFWPWCQPPATVPASELLFEMALAWTRFADHLARRGPLDWLGELSRYEAMRWQAALLAAPRANAFGAPLLAPGAGLGRFTVDVTSLLATAAAGEPVVTRTPIHLIVWGRPAGGVRTAYLGRAAYEAVGMCHGNRTIDQIATGVGAGREAAGRVAAMLLELLQAGALHRSTVDQIPAE
jgi:hypothetical protein